MDLSGKTAIITAGASGIGRVIARRFVEAGAKICVCDIVDEALDALRAELPTALVVKADVSRSADVLRQPAGLTDFSDASVAFARIESGRTRPVALRSFVSIAIPCAIASRGPRIRSGLSSNVAEPLMARAP